MAKTKQKSTTNRNKKNPSASKTSRNSKKKIKKDKKTRLGKIEMNLSSVYYNPKHPASFSGPAKLHKALPQYSKKLIDNWFKKQEAYSLTRPARKHFPRNQVSVAGIDDLWDMDLMDMQSYAKENNGVRYILIVIDIFSRYLWTRPVKSKSSKDVKEALESILKGTRLPNMLRSDSGTEFLNKLVQNMIKKYNVGHYVTHNEPKANYAERVIKTIKMKLTRYMMHNNTAKYINVLQDITHSYNNTKHRSIGVTPASVNKNTESEVRLNEYFLRNKTTKNKNPKFKINDVVRVSHIGKVFDKEYNQKWSGELFRILSVHKTPEGLPVYKIKDWEDDKIEGTFYEYELQRFHVDNNTVYKIDKVLKERTHKGHKQVLVSWLHWPSKFDTWIPAKDVKKYGE